jgi:hypothetical protein
MLQNTRYIYVPNKISIFIDLISLFALLAFCFLLILLGSIVTIAAAIIIMIFILYKFNFVLNIKSNEFTVFHFYKKSIPLESVSCFYVKVYGFGRSRSLGMTMSYNDENGKLNTPTLIHYYWTGNQKIVDLLNFLHGKVEIDIKSFEMIDIVFIDDRFQSKCWKK